jgi:hypothetical protein
MMGCFALQTGFLSLDVQVVCKLRQLAAKPGQLRVAMQKGP